MIRDNIKRICKENGRTIYGLEKSIHISKGYIYNMENPTYNMLKKIADELDVDVCDLIGEEKT